MPTIIDHKLTACNNFWCPEKATTTCHVMKHKKEGRKGMYGR